MKRKIMAILMTMALIVSSQTIYGTTTGIESEASRYDESEQAVDYFNALRQALYDLSPIKTNKELKEMAKFHAKYMSHNLVVTSIEESDYEFYRGRYPWDRALYFKYQPDYVYEFAKVGFANFKEGLESLVNDPVSRSIIFDPVYSEIGMAREGSYYSFEFGGEGSTKDQFVNYPSQKQEDVPVVWKSDDYSNYYKDIDGLPDEVGVPITVTYYGKKNYTYNDISVGMTNLSTNKSVPFIMIEPGENYLLEDTLTILPLIKYDQGSEYQLDIRFNYEIVENDNVIEKPFTKLFSFTTERGVPRTATSPYMTRGMFTEMLVRELVSSQGSDYQLIEPLEARFSDVGINHSKSIYIYTASTEGLIAGFPDNEFKPELNITKEQAYSILVKAYEKTEGAIELPTTDRLASYLDHQTVSFWAYESAQKAVELGIIADRNNLIKPGDYLTEENYDNIISLYQKVLNKVNDL